MLRACISEHSTQWETKLPFIVSAYNASVNSVTHKSPFELIFGKTMALPSNITGSATQSYNYDDYAHDVRENLKYSWKLACEKLIDDTKNLELKIGD